jgi:cytidine deaminase
VCERERERERERESMRLRSVVPASMPCEMCTKIMRTYIQITEVVRVREEVGVVPVSVPSEMLHQWYDGTEKREKDRESISPDQSSSCRPVT